MTIYHLPIQEQRLLEYLKEQGPSSCKEIRNRVSIEHPSTIVSRIRSVYGPDCIKGQWMDDRNQYGEKVRFMMYSLTAEGRNKIWPEKKPFPAWITQYENKQI